jgi:hypothetical protein
MLYLNANFTKAKTCIAPIAVEILALRYRLVLLNCFVPRNDRLQRKAGMTFIKMPSLSLLKKT